MGNELYEDFIVLRSMKSFLYVCSCILLAGCMHDIRITKPETVVKAETVFEISKTVNGSVGTGCQLISQDTPQVRLLKKTRKEEGQQGCIGCSTTVTWTFKAMKPGTAVIRFRNTFRQEKNLPETRYVIHVKK